MNIRCRSLLAGLVLVLPLGIAGAGLRNGTARGNAGSPLGPTNNYLRNLDLVIWERQGSDFTNPRLSPLRLGKAINELDTVYDYDFGRLAVVERRLQGVDRRRVLQAVFERLCAGAGNHTERHLRVLRFLHKATFHNRIQPMYPDRTQVMDPLVLLELGEARCGHVSRIAVDLFEAAGYPGRLVQCAGHVTCEVFYDAGWHLFEANLTGNGETPLLPDGRIPSVAELSQCPELLDRLAVYWEPTFTNSIPLKYGPDAAVYPATHFFSRTQYTTPPIYYVKTATAEQARQSRYYGWEHYQTVPDAQRPLRSDITKRRIPAAPWINEVRVKPQGDEFNVRVSWAPAQDADGDLAGYEVFVSRRTRGWSYDGNSLPVDLMHLKSRPGGWQSECYERRFSRPPAEVKYLETTETCFEMIVPAGTAYYITVMPFDAHGRKVGRKLFPMSEEVKICASDVGGFETPAQP